MLLFENIYYFGVNKVCEMKNVLTTNNTIENCF